MIVVQGEGILFALNEQAGRFEVCEGVDARVAVLPLGIGIVIYLVDMFVQFEEGFTEICFIFHLVD